MSERVLVIDLNRDSEYKQILDGQPRTCGLRSGRVYLEPGQVCDQHSTNANEEMLVFLSGEGQALIGHEEYIRTKCPREKYFTYRRILYTMLKTLVLSRLFTFIVWLQ